ncbi:MAG: hypothetical protein J5786_03710 [Clostridiales bacterium]|nr:hypothetical protein [Clostridiales bacterium]
MFKKKPSIKIISPLAVIFFVISAVLAAVWGVLNSLALGTAAKSAGEVYAASKDIEKKAVYSTFYNSAYKISEKEHHVSNKISIDIFDSEEKNSLEVLNVKTFEYLADKKNNEPFWLEIEGSGSYIVDLNAAEFITDPVRNHVTVRIPDPVLDKVHIDRSSRLIKAESSLLFNGNYKEGVDLAAKQESDGLLLVKKELSGQKYFLNAREASVKIVKDLIKTANPDIPDLTVDVEFLTH